MRSPRPAFARLRYVAVLAASALLLGACSSSGSAAPEAAAPVIEASDGDVSVRLTLPDGALPDGMRLEEISVSLSTGRSAGLDDEGGEQATLTSLSIDLQPSGLVFERPVPVAVSLPNPSGRAMGALLLSGDGEIEALDLNVLPSEVGEAGDAVERIEVEVLVPHFSSLVIWLLDVEVAQEWSIPPPDEPLLVREAFGLELLAPRPRFEVEGAVTDWEVEEGFWPRGVRRPLFRARNVLTEDATLEWSFQARRDRNGGRLGAEVISPAVRWGEQLVRRLNDGSVSGVFECVAPGNYVMSLEGRYAEPITIALVRGPNDVVELTAIGLVALENLTWTGECVAPPGEPATPTSTPDPTPETAEPSSTAVASGARGDAAIKVLMVIVDGVYFPESQFEVNAAGQAEPAHSCERPHYDPGPDFDQTIWGLAEATSTQLVEFANPDVTGCGFGRYDDLERINLWLTLEQTEALQEFVGPLKVTG